LKGVDAGFHLFTKDGKLVKKSVLAVYKDGALTTDGNILPVAADAVAADLIPEIRRFWMSTYNVNVSFAAVPLLPGDGSLSEQYSFYNAFMTQLVHALPPGVSNAAVARMPAQPGFSHKIITLVRSHLLC